MNTKLWPSVIDRGLVLSCGVLATDFHTSVKAIIILRMPLNRRNLWMQNRVKDSCEFVSISGARSVFETLLNLILSEKARINLQESTGSSKPTRVLSGNSPAVVAQLVTAIRWKRETSAAAEKAASR
jgi:hypothetical protein